jgi:hypothetical protein
LRDFDWVSVIAVREECDEKGRDTLGSVAEAALVTTESDEVKIAGSVTAS